MSFLFSGGLFDVIPDSVVDNFEEVLYEDKGNTLSDYYTGYSGTASRVQSPVQEQSYALELTGALDTIRSTSGLPRYPNQGESFGAWVNIGGDSSSSPSIAWGMQSGGGGYTAKLHGSGELRIEDLNSGTLTSSSYSWSANTWYRASITWGTDGSIDVTVYDSSGTSLVSTSTTDTTYTDGGIGFGYGHWASDSSQPQYFDNYHIE